MTQKLDPLAEYRMPVKRASTLPPYAAYSLSDAPVRHLQIRPKFPLPAFCPLYSCLRDVEGDWVYGSRIGLWFTHPKYVTIDGKNLAELFQQIMKGKVEWIQEFCPVE